MPFLRLAENLDSSNIAMQEMLQKTGARFAGLNGGDAMHGHAVALKRLWSLTFREAQVLSFSDAFMVIAVCFGIGALLVLDRLLDMARTAINVFADAACTVIVARLEGEKDVLSDALVTTGATPASTT